MPSNNRQIEGFYENQNILITGGGGFIGKVLIEKLLRVCFELNKIYILIRPKRGKTAEDRFESIFDSVCFEPLKRLRSDFRHQIRLINGDTDRYDWGLSEQDRTEIITNVNVIIHGAANVRFVQPLKGAMAYLKGVHGGLDLARECRNLKVLVHVSTFYSNCPSSYIREEVYKPPIRYEDLANFLDNCDDATVEKITPALIGNWPNTYTYVKAIAEGIVEEKGKGLPIALVRPSIIMSSLEEPLKGWVDNFYGIIGIVSGIYLGVIRSVNGLNESKLNLVPCDYVANFILAAAWDTYQQDNSKVLVYNYAGAKKKLLTIGELMQAAKSFYWEFPLADLVWLPICEIRENILWHKICVFFLHDLQAYVADFVLRIMRRKPFAVAKMAKVNILLSQLAWFMRHSFNWDSGNVDKLWSKMAATDRKNFQFNMEDIEWIPFFRDSIVAGRVYLLKDRVETIPGARRKMYIFTVLHYTLVALFYLLLFRFLLVPLYNWLL